MRRTPRPFVTLVGATTAFFAATVGLVQNDIKRIVAYSTCSQLGYMFVAMGVGAYSVGMFHLFTHAFFKALLFLGSGSVIMAMHHEQDIRNMGGLKNKIPFTYWCMVIGTLALTGFPLTAGYFSKDAIIEAAYSGHNPFAIYGFAMTVIAAGMTAFYSWRLIYKTFHGAPHDQHHYEAAHESPLVILIPLGVLAIGSLGAGFAFKEFFAGHEVEHFFRESLKQGHIIEEMHHVPFIVAWLPTVMLAIGWGIAAYMYLLHPEIAPRLARQHQALYQFLLNKWYFDELYDLIFVRPALWIGRVFWKGGDGYVIDGFGPDGISARVLDVTRNVVRLQSGYLYHYAFAMLIGAAAFITWFMFSGGERTDGDLARAVRHHLPAAHRRAVHRHAARRRGGRPQRPLDGAFHHAGDLRRLAQSGLALRSGLAGIPVRREASVARRLRHLPHGRRRHLAAARHPHHRDHAALHRGELARHQGPRPRIHDRVPGAGNADGRHLLGARSRAVLPVLRGRPHPDVPDHRRLGRSAPGLCELQVLPLHARWLGADAARHHGDVLAVRHHRHPGAAAPRVPARACSPGCGSPSSPRSR